MTRARLARGLMIGLLIPTSLGACGGARTLRPQPPPTDAPALFEARHVYVGERHTEPGDHAVQLEVIEWLVRHGVRVAVGVEWLPAALQPHCDALSAGRLDVQGFVEAVDWHHTWGHDPELYRPLLGWIRGTGVPLRCLDAPTGLARRFAREGREALSEEDRGALTPLDSGTPAHRERFIETMKALARAHGEAHGHLSDERLESLYQAQLLRDETMARHALSWLRSRAAEGFDVLVVFAGRGHLLDGLGIPERVEAGGAGPWWVVLPVGPEEDPPASRPRHLPWLAPR